MIFNASFCYAWTYDDFISFTYNNYQYQNNNSYKDAMINAVTYASQNKEFLSENGYNVDDYSSFYAAYDNQQGSTYFYFFNNTDSTSYSYGNTTLNVSNIQGFRVRTLNYLMYNSFTNITSFSLSKSKGWGLGYSPNNFLYQNEPIIENYLNYIEILPRDNLSINNLPWYIADGRIGVKYNTDNLHFYLHELNSDFFKELLANQVNSYNAGVQYQLFIQNTSGLVNNNEYYISISSSGDSISFLDSNTFLLTWLDNSSPSSSGDSSSNIDLNETNYLIKNLPQDIANTLYNSGDSGEKGIFQKVYEDLFTISQDDINVMLSDFIADNKLSSGEIEIATLGFNTLNNSGDFIISWNSINNDFLRISGDSINFSALVRENKGLNDIMFYVHHILGVSLLLLLLSNYFKTLLATLGVSTEIYEKSNVETEPVESVVITSDRKGRVTKTRTLKTSNGVTYRWKE